MSDLAKNVSQGQSDIPVDKEPMATKAKTARGKKREEAALNAPPSSSTFSMKNALKNAKQTKPSDEQPSDSPKENKLQREIENIQKQVSIFCFKFAGQKERI